MGLNFPALGDTFFVFIRLGRPLFLLGGFLFHGLGVLAALHQGAAFSGAALVWGQITITAIQWMTHYANDYFDLEADRANLTPTPWSGGSRVLPAGLLPPKAALTAAYSLAAVAFAATLVLTFVVRTGAGTLPLLVGALLLAWFYSAPPLRLHSRGIGEATTALLVPLLTPLTGFYLQAGHLEGWLVWMVFPLMCLQFAMLLAIEFPDAEGDRAAGKRTLVVRLGARRAAWLYSAAVLSAYAALPLLMLTGVPWLMIVGIALVSPLALWQLFSTWRGDYANPGRWSGYTFFSAALLMLTAGIQVFTLALSF